jgi:hypothetical protein
LGKLSEEQRDSCIDYIKDSIDCQNDRIIDLWNEYWQTLEVDYPTNVFSTTDEGLQKYFVEYAEMPIEHIVRTVLSDFPQDYDEYGYFGEGDCGDLQFFNTLDEFQETDYEGMAAYAYEEYGKEWFEEVEE